MAYTSDDIITDAKLRAFYPTSGGVISDSDILRLATDELLGILTAQQMASTQGYLAAEVTIPLIGNQQRYDLPYRAAGGKIRYSALVDQQGIRYNIRNGRPERYVTSQPVGLVQNGLQPWASWFEDGRLVIYPCPTSTSYSLVLGIYIRPGRLVTTSNATTASAAAAAGASTISCASLPAHMNGATSVDIISSKPPFQIKAYDLAISTASTGNTSLTVTTPANLVYAVAAGDYITLPEESAVPQLPAEAHPLLSARTAKRILQARGDLTNLQAVMEDIKELEANLFEFLSNRDEGQIDTMSDNALIAAGRSRFGFGLGGF